MSSQALNRIPASQEAIAEDELQYGHGPMSAEELGEKYPNRPHNHGKTFAFHDLYMHLFDPLNNCKKKPTGPTIARAKQGPHGPSKLSPAQQKVAIIERFISRWRSDVGNDFYPAIRLICPDKDRDRPMYGLKEKAIGKLLVKLLKLNPNSEDGFKLLNWKIPGKLASRMAGDFAGVCHDVIAKRPMMSKPGDLTIAEVNELLDKLAAAQKEDAQLVIFKIFYTSMNASELMWLIRIILRQMKVGASENTFLDKWHPDGMSLFNVSSSLRRVCWELTNPTLRLEGDTAIKINLMSPFQPQLAQFQPHSFSVMVSKLGVDAGEPGKTEFWIEEKLDGERMQMHMITEKNGHKRFAFWSRKAKDYTYLYGESFEDENSSLTRFIKNAFDERVDNIILDGEMITWDPERGVMVPFGTLKTAALGQQRNVYDDKGIRPLFRVFDCLYLNDTDLTKFELRDRRAALKSTITDVHERIEILQYTKSEDVKDIEPKLRDVIANQAEGLVLKNPRSPYELNSRNDNWMKVKPEYMTEFGESLDCLIIGGYYGSGHRGGGLSSFLCGLRVDPNSIQSQGANPMKFYSFCKVGGGFRAEDYANIKHHTDGKWIDWDFKNPPTQYIELGGSDGQAERPDQWILPGDSVVVEVKAASVGASTSFRTNFTLRFPRFKKLRMDKDWQSALSRDEFLTVKERAEAEAKEKDMTVDNSRKKISKRFKKQLVIAGNDSKIKAPYAGPKTQIFEGLTFCVLTEVLKPIKKSKAELEQIIKSNGGKLTQNPRAVENTFCIGEKNVLKVASIVRDGKINIIKPSWILDALKQAGIDGPSKETFLVPLEPSHMFHTTPDVQEGVSENVDMYDDSYTRDITGAELQHIFDQMAFPKNGIFSSATFLTKLEKRGKGFRELPGSLFKDCVAWFAPVGESTPPNPEDQLEHRIYQNRFMFAGGRISESELDEETTHFVLVDYSPTSLKSLRATVAGLERRKLPRVVQWTWLRDCWAEKTLIDEERYAVT